MPEASIRDECLHRFRDLEAKVYKGNGQPSHAERLATLERADATKTWLLRVIVGGVLSNLIATALLLLRAYAK